MSDEQLPNDAYGHTVIMSTDGITDSYLVGGTKSYDFAAGTAQAAVYLSIAKQFNIARAAQALQDFSLLQYSLVDRFGLLAIYNAAIGSGLTARAAYIFQVFTWATSCTCYAATYIANINSQTDADIIATIVPNFAILASSNPLVTSIAAVQINS